MGRALLVINTAADRQKAKHWVDLAPWGTRIEYKASKRTLPQNDRMWAMLTDVATHMKAARGLDYETEEWKLIFLSAWGREVRWLPALDGKGVVPVPHSSSDLSKEEMTDFIEFIFKEGAERGVTFHDPKSEPSSPSTPAPEDAAVEPSSPSIGSAAPDTRAAGLEADGIGARAEPDAPSASEPDMVNSAGSNVPALKAEMVKKLLQLAGDSALTARERLENLDSIKPAWIDRMPGFPVIVDQCFATAGKIIRGELKHEAARKFMEAI